MATITFSEVANQHLFYTFLHRNNFHVSDDSGNPSKTGSNEHLYSG